jgi:hypothetical protein
MIPILGLTMRAVCVKANGLGQVEEQVSGDRRRRRRCEGIGQVSLRA